MRTLQCRLIASRWYFRPGILSEGVKTLNHSVPVAEVAAHATVAAIDLTRPRTTTAQIAGITGTITPEPRLLNIKALLIPFLKAGRILRRDQAVEAAGLGVRQRGADRGGGRGGRLSAEAVAERGPGGGAGAVQEGAAVG